MSLRNKSEHKEYINMLRRMSPEERLFKAFEISDFTKKLFVNGLRKRFPDLNDQEFKLLLMKRLDKCHNRNY